jgi:transposase
MDIKFAEQLLEIALHIREPWKIIKIDFPQEGKDGERLDIYIDFIKGTIFPCPVCGGPATAYDTRMKTWRHRDFFEYETYFHARVPRVKCGDCGAVKKFGVPWARSESGLTTKKEMLLMSLVREMPVNAVSRIFNITDTRIWRMVHYYTDKARSMEDYSAVTRVGFDETSVKKGHNDYISLFYDMDGRRLLFGTRGKDNQTVKAFADDLIAHGGDPLKITDAAIDMSGAFIKGTTEQLPNANITFDKFHVVKGMNETMKKVRHQEFREYPEKLAKTKFLFLKNPEDLSDDQAARLDTAIASHCNKSIETYTHKLNLQNVYRSDDREEADGLMTHWLKTTSESTLWQVRKFSKTVKDHLDGIMNHFDSGLTSGFIEGINSLIKSAKSKARGYRNPDNMICIAYLIAGKLDFTKLFALPT